MEGLTQLPERFANKIMPTVDGCWLWTAACNKTNGYGRVSVGRQTRYAHREVYEHLVGAIPEGKQIDHLCRQRSCVNPAHLEPVTNRTNILRGDGFAARRAKQTHCKRGHPFSSANTYIQPNGTRACRKCQRLHLRKYWVQRGKDWFRPN